MDCLREETVPMPGRLVCELQKKVFCFTKIFCLVSSQNVKKILNQGFSIQVKIIVLFSEKNCSCLT